MWSIHQQCLMLPRPTVKGAMHLQENTLFDLDPKAKVTLNVAQYPYIMWPIHLQGLRLICSTVKEMYLQENTLFDL